MDGKQLLEEGRSSYGQSDWSTAFGSLSRADSLEPLAAGDLEKCALAAYLTGRNEEFRHYLGRAYQEYQGHQENRAASRAAFWLGFEAGNRGDGVQASAWLSRSERHLQEEPEECAERGYLLLARVPQLLASQRNEEAFECASRAEQLARRCGDEDLRAFANHARGVSLLRQGEVEAGMRLLDETLLSLVSGEPSSLVAGVVYCSAISACRSLFDLRRMHSWTIALSNWCAKQPGLVPYAGECRVFRSELHQLHGEWANALAEVEQVLESDALSSEQVRGMAWYQLGEIRRLRGEHEEAESAFLEAHRFGRDPQPGLALLWIDSGRIEAAANALRRALQEASDEQRRSRLLPAYSAALLAQGKLDEAGESARELTSIASRLKGDADGAAGDTNLLEAVAQEWTGRTALARGQPADALSVLRLACSNYQQLGARFDMARTRVALGQACLQLGDDETAAMELSAAHDSFAEFGAESELRSVEQLLHGQERAQSNTLSPRERQVLSLVAAGHTNRSIAKRLGLSARTVDRHLSNIFDKLSVTSRAAAAVRGIELGLVSVEENSRPSGGG